MDIGRQADAAGDWVMVTDRDRRAYIWRGPGTSDRTIFQDLTLVGDSTAFTYEEFSTYQRQHAHGFIGAGTAGGRLNVTLRNVKFKNFTGNGAYFKDAGVWIDNYEGFDCFRGVWSATRNVNILATNGRSFGRDGGIDVEPEGGPPGKVVIRGLVTSHDFDISLLDGWTAEVEDVIALSGPINFVVRGNCSLTVRNSSFQATSGTQIELRTLGHNATVIFDNVDFNDCPLLWQQNGGSMVLLDLRTARNIGDIQQTKYARPDINILLQ
jgi:hypothetical protein